MLSKILPSDGDEFGSETTVQGSEGSTAVHWRFRKKVLGLNLPADRSNYQVESLYMWSLFCMYVHFGSAWASKDVQVNW